MITVGAETVGEQAARTACSHDDEIELGDGAHFGIIPPSPLQPNTDIPLSRHCLMLMS
jgi:hypothetical protein